MATSKLERYNAALGHLEARRLRSLSEKREPRRVLDDYWNDTVAYALERGYWNHAMRAIEAQPSASITPTFGYTYAYTKPDDWVRTYEMSAHPDFYPPLIDREYVDEPGLWYCNVSPLFVKYVSDHPAYGLDLSLWPASFSAYVSLRLAAQACMRITGSDEKLEGSKGLLERERRALAIALASDAMNEPVKLPPAGTWVGARRAGSIYKSRWDRRS